jgi:hypothetical protein
VREAERHRIRCGWVAAAALAVLSVAAHAAGDVSESPGAPEEPAEESLAVVEVKRALDATARALDSESSEITLSFADTFDWVRTTSGEWVRGDIDWMRDDNMEFNSEEFGPLQINMREVAEVHSPTTNTYVFADRSSLVGPAMITNGHVVIQTEAGVVARPQAELLWIIDGGTRELDHWSLAVDLGLGLNRGNSNQADINMRVGIIREDRRTLSELGYLLNLGYADREVNVTRHVLGFSNRVWLTRLWFVEPIVGQLLSDRFQDVRFRAQPAVAGGLRFLYRPSKVHWDLAVGAGYQYLRLFEPFIGIENPQHDGLTRFETRARVDFTPDVYITLSWVTNLTFTTLGNTNHTGFAELFFEVTNVLNLQASLLYLRTRDPPARGDGNFPVKNDYFFTLGVSLQLG